MADRRALRNQARPDGAAPCGCVDAAARQHPGAGRAPRGRAARHGRGRPGHGGLPRAKASQPRPPAGRVAVVIELDTPGGSLEATRDIVQAQLERGGPGPRVGRPGRQPGGQCRHLPDPGRPRGGHGTGDQHRRRHPHLGRRLGHPRRPGRQGPRGHHRHHHVHRRGTRTPGRLGRQHGRGRGLLHGGRGAGGGSHRHQGLLRRRPAGAGGRPARRGGRSRARPCRRPERRSSGWT